MLAKLPSAKALLLAAMVSPIVADRPDNTSICDYYAAQQFGASNVTTQLRLMSSIVALAYAGGQSITAGQSMDARLSIPGIFNADKYDGKPIFLRPYFDGTNETTNLNDVAVATNWLDGGGTDPLLAFIRGSTATPEIKKDTNQETLFTHWYVAFGRIYDCSMVESFVTKKYKTLMPAYVHKYMNLTSPEIAYFIHQMILASTYYGFSDQDARALELTMNSRYNTRCAPPDSNNQLLSICLSEESCPLAAPKADCDAYTDVKPYGVDSATAATPGATSATTPTPTPGPGGYWDPPRGISLGDGDIAGIVVGGVAGVALVAGAIWYFIRKRRGKQNAPVQPAESVAVPQTKSAADGDYRDPSMNSPQMGYAYHNNSSFQSPFMYQGSFNNNTVSSGVGQESPLPPLSPRSAMTGSPPQAHGGPEMEPQELQGLEVSRASASPSQAWPYPGSSPHHVGDWQQLAEMDCSSPPELGSGRATPQVRQAGENEAK